MNQSKSFLAGLASLLTTTLLYVNLARLDRLHPQLGYEGNRTPNYGFRLSLLNIRLA